MLRKNSETVQSPRMTVALASTVRGKNDNFMHVSSMFLSLSRLQDVYCKSVENCNEILVTFSINLYRGAPDPQFSDPTGSGS